MDPTLPIHSIRVGPLYQESERGTRRLSPVIPLQGTYVTSDSYIYNTHLYSD